MRLLKAKVQNFQSYKELEFDFSNLGLTLLSGDTGAGKSTILDIPAWIMFGITSKDSNADDIKTWGSEEPTRGTLELELADSHIEITRIRGKSNQNDLFFKKNNELPTRGKDSIETQKLINKLLGVDSELYLIASYFHQFSAIDSFFTAKAKDRRDLMEKLADLSMPVELADKLSIRRKIIKESIKETESVKSYEEGRINQLTTTKEALDQSALDWNVKLVDEINSLKKASDNYELDKTNRFNMLVQKLEKLDKLIQDPRDLEAKADQAKNQVKQLASLRRDKEVTQKEYFELSSTFKQLKSEYSRFHTDLEICPHCLGPTNNDNKNKYLNEIEVKISDIEPRYNKLKINLANLEKALSIESSLMVAYQKAVHEHAANAKLINDFETSRASLEVLQYETNRFQEQIEKLESKPNPHLVNIDTVVKQLEESNHNLLKYKDILKELDHELISLNFLYDTSFELRSVMLSNAVRDLEIKTNECLSTYFDAELKVLFNLETSDKLEVEIQKNGNSCNFKQLSGGQRRILKLAFGISVMKLASMKAGVSFSLLSFDEVLNGLDDRLKIKAFNLFQSLENEIESIILIDHCSELKGMFSNQFNVIINGDSSEVVHVR